MFSPAFINDRENQQILSFKTLAFVCKAGFALIHCFLHLFIGKKKKKKRDWSRPVSDNYSQNKTVRDNIFSTD